MMRLFPMCAALLVTMLANSAAYGQSVERTYSGDPFEEEYKSAALALFAYLPDYDCSFDSSVDETEARKKFLEEHELAADTPTIMGSCRFSGQKCFVRRGVNMMCFDNGGVMVIERMKFSKRMTAAAAELAFALSGTDGKVVGVGFSRASLKKSDSVWGVAKFEDTGGWDLRKSATATSEHN